MTVRVSVTLELQTAYAEVCFPELDIKACLVQECRAHGDIVASSITPLVEGCDTVDDNA